jgi:phenylpropionate dioxygenase-like ring-hydroxylating dioxygenase large terminal subunit
VNFHDFWYVLALSEELRAGVVLPRQVLGEWLAVFRGTDGRPVALQDRCMHRAGRLSKGVVRDGCLRCPYHGWTYDPSGALIAVPAEGEAFAQVEARRAVRYTTAERDGYVYVRLSDGPEAATEPFPMPSYGAPGFTSVRLINRFENNVTNCVENFIDVPHTVWVHPGIFRTERRQRIDATVTRKGGTVEVVYRNETDNLGWFRWFLNPDGHEIGHVDRFYMPNVTSVEYVFGPRRRFFITSQSVPVHDEQTLVYTDLTFDYGVWNPIARPLVAWQGQRVIDQDLVALQSQQEVIRKYGAKFSNTAADTIHVFVESIRGALEQGRDPRELPERTRDLTFWV